MKRILKTAALVGLSWLLGPGVTHAERLVFRPDITTTQWRTALPELPVRELRVQVRKVSGSETFFNMRFGREGHTFDGRRVYLPERERVKASWDLHGRRPQGQELILNSYNGAVHVERVEVVFDTDQRDAPRRVRTGGDLDQFPSPQRRTPAHWESQGRFRQMPRGLPARPRRADYPVARW